MSIQVTMPALSPTMEKGSIAKWLVSVGDAIRAGDPIAEVETDKATMEIEASDEGTLVDILVQEGTADVSVGTPIATIGQPDEVNELSVKAAEQNKRPVAEASMPLANVEVSVRHGDGAPERQEASTVENAANAIPVRATPLARRLADARGLHLPTIRGSGPNGKVVAADIGIASRKAALAPAKPQAVPHGEPHQFDMSAQREIPHEEVPLSSMRKTIARRLTEAKQQVPHIYLTVDVQLDALLALRSEVNGTLASRGAKISVNDMILKALALALMEVPSCNVAYAGDTLLQYRRADISVAVSIPNGLITPVIRQAEGKALSAIASESRELATRAREGKLKPDEYQGGTASISNMGMMGIRQFDAVINPPQAMILGVGAAEERTLVRNGTVVIATMLTITGSFDHRAVDGAEAASLMNAVRRLLEQPMGLLA